MLKRLPNAPVLGGVLDDVTACTQALQDGDTLRIGRDVHVRCLHTPGHTNGHLCYVATSEKEGQAEGAVFTGDTLFIGGAGRFFEGSPEDMQFSLSKLASLPPKTSVYCGHEVSRCVQSGEYKRCMCVCAGVRFSDFSHKTRAKKGRK